MSHGSAVGVRGLAGCARRRLPPARDAVVGFRAPRRFRFAVVALVAVALPIITFTTGANEVPMPGIRPLLTLEFSPTTGPFDTPVWVDISDYWMRDAEVSGGKQSELPEFSPSRMSVVLNNSDRRFDPNYTAGPYFGYLKPRRPIRLSALYGPVLVDSAGGQWMLSVDTDGALVTTAVEGKSASGTIVISDSGGTEWALSVGTDGVLATATTADPQANVPVLRDTAGQNWSVTVDTSGALTTTATTTAATGVHRRLFTGFVDSWPQEYEPPRLGLSRVTATDAMSVLATLATQSVWEQEIRSHDPWAWYRLGEDSGSAAQDASGNGNHGTYIGGATFNNAQGLIVGDDDGAISFDGVDDQMTAEVPVKVFGSFTVVSKVQHEATDFGLLDFPTIISLVDTSLRGVLLYYVVGGKPTAQVYFDDGTSTLLVPTAPEDVDYLGQIATLGLTYDASAGTATFYVDGSAIDSTSPGAGKTVRVSKVHIGSDESGTEAFVDDPHWTGVLDDTVIFDSALSADDHLALYNAGHAPWDEDSPTTRITAILDDAGFPTANRNLDTGSAQLGIFSEGNTLKSLQDVGAAESGRSMQYVDGAGRWTFVGRHDFWTGSVYTTSQATLGDSSTELGYSVRGGFRIDYDDFDIINAARIAPIVGWFQEFTSTGSVDDYGPAGIERRIIEKRPEVALNTAEYLASERKDSVGRLNDITLQPEHDPDGLYPVILSAEFGHRFTVKRRPQDVGDAIALEAHLEHATHRLTPGSWETRWRLGRAEQDYWILDVSALDVDTRLGF